MKDLRLNDRFKIVVNSITDSGVLFNVGNMIINFQNGWKSGAGWINAGVASICLGVRAISELKAAGIDVNLKGLLGRQFNKMAENKGLALATSGILTLIAAGVAALQADPSRPHAYGPSKMLTCFGLVHSFRGAATGLREGVAKYSMDAAAFAMAFGGYMFANPNLPFALKISYGSIAALAVYMMLTEQKAHGWKQPDLYFALTSYIAATQAQSPEVAIGFASWASAYLSIDAMRKTGGPYETIQHFLNQEQSKNPQGPNPDDP